MNGVEQQGCGMLPLSNECSLSFDPLFPSNLELQFFYLLDYSKAHYPTGNSLHTPSQGGNNAKKINMDLTGNIFPVSGHP